MQGYVKVYRKLMCGSIWQDPDLFRLWMYCLMKATHKDRKEMIEKQEVPLSPGQFITGRFKLHFDFNNGLSPKKQVKETTLWSWLKKLETFGNIDIKSYNKFSVVTVLNWNEYQGKLTTEQQQTDNKTTTKPQQIDTNKNVKNENNDKNEKKEDIPYVEIVSYLNVKTSSSYKSAGKATKDLIKARWNEGYTLEDFKKVIDIKTDEWINDSKMSKFLRPATLFSNKFENYLNQKVVQAKGQWDRMTEKTPEDEAIFGNPIDYEYDENDLEY